MAQSYDQTRRRLHNRLLHTWGIAEGLTIGFAANASRASISAGTAFDNLGREVVLPSAALAPSVSGFTGQTVFLTIAYSEADSDPHSFNGVTDYTRTTETPLLQVSPTPPSNPGTQLILGRLVVSSTGTIVSSDDGVEPNRRRLAGAAGTWWPDQLGMNGGGLTPGLQFGGAAGREGIASKRTSGGNQNGLDLYTNNTPRLSITNAGFVGIGTQSPGSSLQVEGDVRVNGLYVDKANTNSGGLSPALVFAVGSGEGIASRRTAGGNQYGLDLWTGGVIRMSLTNAGRVGVGSSAPGAQLSVVAPGAGELLGVAHSTTLRTSAGSLGTSAWTEQPLASFGFSSGNASALGIRAIRIANGGDWTTTAIGLGMDVDNTVRVNASGVYLHANGNFGVGTSLPQSRLHVYGDVRVDGRLKGDVTIEGRLGLNGQSPVPRTPGWAGGVHTWDLEVEGSAWCRYGWASGPRDVAELFESRTHLNAGEVVAFDLEDDAIVRSSAPNDSLVCGVVSTAPGMLLNFDPEQVGRPGLVPVALCGRVPCRVVDENGPILRGDLLTSSSVPGYAMRAEPIMVNGRRTYQSGTVIGKALAAHTAGAGVIDVFVSPS